MIKKNNKSENLEVISIIMLLVLLTVMIIQSHNDIPARLFRFQGYDIDGIYFEKVKNDWWKVDIYKSSQPISISEDEFCDLWQVKTYGNSGLFQVVIPYKENNGF